ncbi:MAG: hypothetical protein AAF763_13155 [Pseudomonadota bacterium]
MDDIMKRVSFALAALALSGCATASPEPERVASGETLTTEFLAGKTSRTPGGVFRWATDGTFAGELASGEPISGTWSVEEGRFCRTIAAPERISGSECQTAVINTDGTLTVENSRGARVTSVIEDPI